MFTVSEIRHHIKKYIDFLQSKFGFGISIHPHLYEELIATTELSDYHIHSNPYCHFLKNYITLWEHCLDCQEKVYKKCLNGPYIGICHAGVKEYVYPINNKDTVIGFLSVTGYKAPPEKRADYLKKISKLYGIEFNTLSENYERFLIDEFPDKESMDTLIMPLLHMLELAYIQMPDFPENEPHGQVFYLRILHYIHLNYSNNLTLERISRDLNFSKSYISHTFKMNTGYTINRYINLLKIKRAKDMLVSTDINMTELSMALGFSSSNYFTIVFKEFEKITPTEYRNKYSSSE